MNRTTLRVSTLLVTFIVAATAIASSAQTLKVLDDFEGASGAYPGLVALAQGLDGNLYGTTQSRGAFSGGTVFQLNPQDSALTTIHAFCGSCPGNFPSQGVILATDGNFYGVTASTVYRITSEGVLTTLYTFCSEPCSAGMSPRGALVQGVDTNLYGTTTKGGGSTNCSEGCGTVFKITLQGRLTTLHSFDSTDGSSPQAPLVQGSDGSFYGTAYSGGHSCNCGTVFKITSQGKFTTLYEFSGTDGANPGGLVQSPSGNFYGTTASGGSAPAQAGTVFEITPQETLTTLYSFTGGTDGEGPSVLFLGTDGNFYGTSLGGGAIGICPESFNGCGTIFSITTNGSLTTLTHFSFSDGDGPCGLVQTTSGVFYGVSNLGGDNVHCGGIYGCGTIWSFNMGLGPFVSLVQAAGGVGTKVGILGQGFSGASSVSFNGTAAKFSVLTDTAIKATVPAGATSGSVTVVTSSGTLTSNKPFTVIP